MILLFNLVPIRIIIFNVSFTICCPYKHHKTNGVIVKHRNRHRTKNYSPSASYL